MQSSTFKPARASSSTKTVHAQKSAELLSAVLPATGYVRLPAVVAVAGIAKSTIWKWCAEGKFPKPVKLSPRVSAWSVLAIREWVADPVAWQAVNMDGGARQDECQDNQPAA